MSVGIGLKRCCLECSRPRLELVEIKRGIFDRDVNVCCECSDVYHAYIMDEGDVVSVQNCDRDALLRLARYMDKDVAETEAHFSNVISTKSVSNYARRIRKALGVES